MMYRNGDEYKINDMNQAHGISGQFDANTLRYPWKHTFFPIWNQSTVIDFNSLLISVNASYFDRHKPL